MRNSKAKRIIALLLCLVVFAGSELSGMTNIVGELFATETPTANGEGNAPVTQTTEVELSAQESAPDGQQADGKEAGNSSPEVITTGDSEVSKDPKPEQKSEGEENSEGQPEAGGEQNGEGETETGKEQSGGDGSKTDKEQSGGDGSETDKEQSGGDGSETVKDQNGEGESEAGKEQSGEGESEADGDQNGEGGSEAGKEQSGEGQPPVNGTQPAEGQPADGQKPADPVPSDTDDTEIIYETAGDADSAEELATSPNNMAGSFMRFPMNAKRRTTHAGNPEWSFDAYYVNEADRYQVTKTDDFSLKYQMEFHASDNFAPGDIRIEIKEALFTYRTKEMQPERKATPSDIGVPPRGEWNEETKAYDFTASRSTPFNWYVENGKLVFYNYKQIDAGTNAAWQVLYSDLKIMDITDETSWSMKPEVYINNAKSDKEVSTLTGRVNSSVSLTEVVKTPYYETGKKYTPGLYTLDQLKTYAGNNIDSKYIDQTTGKLNTTKYRYVVWDVKVRGDATQPWTMYIQDNPSAGGEVVGYRDNFDRTTVYDYEIKEFASPDKDGKVEIAASGSERSWGHRFQVVTAYPASVLPGDEVQNDLTVTLEPKDKIDPDEVVRATPASWKYKDYDWKYEGDVIGTQKWNGWGSDGSDETEYTGWLEVWRRSDKDYGDIPYTVTGHMKGYEFTHEVSGPNLGAYKEGTSYTLTTADDYLYAVEEGGITHAMGKDDYYFSSVTVSQTDHGYDIYEDRTDKSERAALVEAKKLSADFGKVKIYAMFAKDKSMNSVEKEGTTEKDWEPVGEVGGFSMNADGTFEYSFSQTQIDREPYRVKVEHESVDYSTECKIQLAVRLKKTSGTDGAMKDLMTAHDMYQESPKIMFENLSGVMGVQKTGNSETKVYASAEDLNKDTILAGGVKSETSYNYTDREDLAGKTGVLYGGLLVRDNAQRTVTWLETTARANKKYSSRNDAANNRVLVDYYLTAYDGYLLYDQSSLNYMSGIDKSLASPGRKQVVFYDLLPYGMQFDASTTVRAGRIRELDSRGNYMESPNDWDRTQVSVTVDPAKDIKTNYKGTGRTMVAFHITYSGADPAVYTNGKWVEGWGGTFRAYYDWKDMDTVNKEANANLAAFMPDFGKGYIDETNRKNPRLYGLTTQVYEDDGVIDNAPAKSRVYADLIGGGGKIDDPWIDVADKNADGTCKYDKETIVNEETGASTIKWNPNVLYAETTVNDNVATSSQSTLQKLVRADKDGADKDVDQYGGFRESAVAAEGGTYTYELTVSAPLESPVGEIAVFDRLEAASPESERAWTPQFLGVDLEALEKQNTDVNAPETEDPTDPDVSETQKVPVTVYYNESSDAVIPVNDGDDPHAILNDLNNGWYTADSVKDNETWQSSSVRAVAVLFDADYVLDGGHSVSFRIRMQAPADAKEWKGKYAYNEATFSSMSTTDNTRGVVTCKQTRVSVSKMERLEIVKRTSGVVPTAFKDTEFEFKVYEAGEKKADDKKLSFLSYELYRADRNGKWDEEPDGQPHATDENGCLYLKANEKAVFHVADPDRITVEESTNIFWESSPDVSNPTRGGTPVEERYTETVTETKDETTGEVTKRTVTRTQRPDGDIHVRTWTNTFRPVLYVQKELIAGPETVDDTFTFQLKVKKNGTYVEAANTPYWYVDSVRTDGSLPVRLKEDGQPWPDADSAGSQAPHKTDANGKFTIKQGQIIALFPGTAGTQYQLEELNIDKTGYSVKEDGSLGDWYCEEPKVTDGTLKAMGSEETITNYYRWKDLNLTKEITHQDAAECEQSFSFQIVELKLDANGQPKLDEDKNVIPLKKNGKMTTAGLQWDLLNADGSVAQSATLDDNGELHDCLCAGKTIRVHKLDACKYYMVKELPVTADATEHVVLYRPTKDSEQFKVLPAATAQDVTITNDYLKRPLTVKKTVTGKKEGDPEFTFTVKVNGQSLPATTPYTVTKQGTAVASGEVDESGNFVQKIGETTVTGNDAYRLTNGKFKLHDGESITFEDAGLLGQTFEVTEDANPDYKQLYPAAEKTADGTQTGETKGNAPATGTLLGEGGEASFVNGTANALYISKEYVTDETDSTKPAVKLKTYWESKVRELEGSIRPAGFVSGDGKNYSSVFTLEVTEEGKGTYIWPEKTIELTGTNQLNGNSVSLTWKAGQSIYLTPWIIFSIPVGTGEGEIPPTASYKLTEAESSQKRIVGQMDAVIGNSMFSDIVLTEDEYVQITQKYPSNGGSVSGTVESAPTATIVNKLTSLNKFEGSKIGKRMTAASHTVPTGQKLVWKLEKYVGEIPASNEVENWYDENNWQPAAGIQYAVFKDDGTPLSGEVITTDSEGRIELEKPEEGYPEVRFVSNQVYIDLYDPSKIVDLNKRWNLFSGTEWMSGPLLRMVEVPEESEKEWGLPAGYGTDADGNFSWNLYGNGEEPMRGGTVYFFNSNSRSSIKIEKYTKRPTSQDFKMILKQVLGTTDNSISVNDIDDTNYGKLVSEPRDGVEYTIHNVDGTTVEGRTGDVTKSGGEITLRTGQYVTLDVPEGTVWTVEEDGYASQNYKLTDLEDTAASGRTKRLALDTTVDPVENLMLINIPAPLTRYTLRFDANGGTLETPVLVKNSDAGSVTFDISGVVPTRTGYIFRGWQGVESGNVSVTLDSENPTKTLQAIWESGYDRNYKLTYIPNGPVGDEKSDTRQDISSDWNATVWTQDQAGYKREGYIFLGWSENPEASEADVFPGQTIHFSYKTDGYKERTLYAVWQKLEFRPTPIRITIAYDGDTKNFLDNYSSQKKEIAECIVNHSVVKFDLEITPPHGVTQSLRTYEVILETIKDKQITLDENKKIIYISGMVDWPAKKHTTLSIKNYAYSNTSGLAEDLKKFDSNQTEFSLTFSGGMYLPVQVE